ncbi:MAG: lipopolysaccharide biosynthesis protein [Anaerolineales bacterium]|nr:lipopolysaccharide biosynthesis protein [Anaerolineales bacterium]
MNEASNTVFTFNLLAGIGLTGITYLVAPYAANFFHEANLIPVLRWLGISFTISALGSTHNIRLQRALKFQKKLIPDIGNTLIKGLVSIILALNGFGVWSLVIGQLVGAGISSVLLWIVVPWRPQLSINPAISKKFFSYGLTVMADNTLSILGDSFDYLMIGRVFNTAALGVYTLAYRLPEILVINVLWVMTAVLFPAFSEIQHRADDLRKNFLAIIRYVELLVTPICIGMIIAADPIIRVLFGEQWLQAIPIMQILSGYAFVLSIGFHVGDIYKAIGRPDILLKIAIPVFIIRITALWIGAQYSLLGVAIAHLCAGVVEVAVRLIVATHIVEITFTDILAQLRAFLGGIVLIAFALPVLLVTQNTIPLIRLLLVALSGTIGYTLAIWFLERETFLLVLRVVGLQHKPVRQSP